MINASDGGAFGPGARRLAGAVGRLLGWRPDAFWAATPAELSAIFTTDQPAITPLSRAELTRLLEQDHDQFK